MSEPRGIVDDIADQWPKIAALLVWKLAGANKTVTLAPGEIDRACRELGMPCIVSNADERGLHFRVVSLEEARRIIYQRQQTHQPVKYIQHGPKGE